MKIRERYKSYQEIWVNEPYQKEELQYLVEKRPNNKGYP
jgi:hypothetical protein